MDKVKKVRQKCCSSIRETLRSTTVEPAAFFFICASSIASLSTSNLSLDKTCRVNLNLTEATCDMILNHGLEKDPNSELVVQRYLANHLLWRSVIQSALPCLLYPFVGGWMDKTARRKIWIILPIFGEILLNLSNILNVVFFYQLPLQALLFYEVSFGNMFGGWSVLLVAAYSYVAIITTDANRTFRLGMLQLVFVGAPIGQSLSGIILKNYGYFATYGIALVMQILSLCYVVFAISDVDIVKEVRNKIRICTVFFTFMSTFTSRLSARNDRAG